MRTFLLDTLFASKLQTRVVEVLLRHPSKHFTLSDMKRRVGASLGGVASCVERLEEAGYIKEINMKGVHLFTLNRENRVMRLLAPAYQELREDIQG